jgi:hypothetical protein
MAGKLIINCCACVCIVLVTVSTVIVAQTARPSPKSATKRASDQIGENRRPASDDLLKHQLQVLREHVLARVLENIKKMDEPGLRLSARNQVLGYLGSDKVAVDENSTLTTQIVREALEDLRRHYEEINSFMLSYLANDLRSWIQKHTPNLIEECEKTIKATVKPEASQHIRSLFELENGDTLAAKRIRQELEDQGSLNGLIFWLDELIKRNSKEFEPLASDIVTRAGQGQITFETLFWISDVYLRPQTSTGLKTRFLRTIVARTQIVDFAADPTRQFAYDLLTQALPFIQQFAPELYDQALNQSVAMRASLSETRLAAEARIKRLKESATPIEDLKSEAESAKSKAERNSLLLQAAELALEKQKLGLCLEILSEIDVDATASDQNLTQLSADQLLRNLVKASLTAKVPLVAEKGAARIGSLLIRVEALSLIMRYYVKLNEKEAALKILIEASKAADLGPDNSDKAKAFFLLSRFSDQVDVSRKADLLFVGVKALNNFSTPDTSARDRSAYQSYVQRLDNTGYELTKGFQSLTKQDQNSALALVERLQKPDLKTFALIGILLGLDGLRADRN